MMRSRVSGMGMTRAILIVALVTAGLLVAGSPAQATVIYDLTSDHCTGGCGTPPFGTVSLTQTGTTVDITVHLFNGSLFIKSGAGDFENFKFNGVDVALGDITVDAHIPALAAETGAFNGDGTGQFSFGITCPTCKNGAAGGYGNDIVFHVADATIADLTQPNNLGNLFVADIFSGQTGFTGPVDVNGESPCIGCLPRVPEPGTLLLLGSGLSLAGFLGWRRRQR